MTVSLVQWRAVIGVFNCRSLVMSKNSENYLVNNFISLIESLLLLCHYFESAYIFLFTLLYLFVLLQCHGDIELNPGPKNLLSEMNDNNKKMIVLCNLPLVNFAHFLLNFEQLLSDTSTGKPTVSIITDDFNARSSS